MKKPLLIWVSALTLLASATLLFAQTTTGSSLITQMKAATHAFTLSADLNSGATGLESAPLVGKRTGDMLSAGEYNRILELVGMWGSGNIVLNTPVTVDELTLLPVWNQARSIDLSTKTSVPAWSTHAVVNIHCGVCSGNPGACNSPNNPESITVTRMDGKTMCRAYSGLLKSGNPSIDSYNGDMDTNTTYIALESDGKTIKYSVEQNNTGDGEQGYVEVLGFVTSGSGGGGGGGGGTTESSTSWITFDGTTTTPTVKSKSGNISGIQRYTNSGSGVGRYEILFNPAMPNVNYAISANAQATSSGGLNTYICGYHDKTVNSVKITVCNITNAIDSPDVSVTVHK